MQSTELLSMLVPLIGKHVLITNRDATTWGNNFVFSGRIISVYTDDGGSGMEGYLVTNDGQTQPVNPVWLDLMQIKVSA